MIVITAYNKNKQWKWEKNNKKTCEENKEEL